MRSIIKVVIGNTNGSGPQLDAEEICKGIEDMKKVWPNKKYTVHEANHRYLTFLVQ